MRTILILASAALASATAFAGPARADARLHLTPPLYREQARLVGQVRSVSDMTTTPQPVLASATRRRTVSVADRFGAQAAVEATR